MTFKISEKLTCDANLKFFRMKKHKKQCKRQRECFVTEELKLKRAVISKVYELRTKFLEMMELLNLVLPIL